MLFAVTFSLKKEQIDRVRTQMILFSRQLYQRGRGNWKFSRPERKQLTISAEIAWLGCRT